MKLAYLLGLEKDPPEIQGIDFDSI